MEKKLIITPDRARGFLAAVIREWDSQGLYIKAVKVKRNEEGELQGILLTYEEREPETDREPSGERGSNG